jgi:predicted HAD superfamily hydrolase
MTLLQSPYWSTATVLSLDIFDTLISRQCAYPETVFSLLENYWCKHHGTVFNGFAQKRRDIDRLARRHAWQTRQCEEISLEDIYMSLLQHNPDWPVPIVDLMEKEMSFERQLLYPVPGRGDWLKAARNAGKSIILVSDMYLPEAFCVELLAACGFEDYDHLFLSSSVGKLKSTGNLFHHVIAALKVDPTSILHVGDNPHSDGKQAKACGMRSHIISKVIDSVKELERHPIPLPPTRTCSMDLDILHALSARGIAAEKQSSDPFWYRIGFQFGGPLVYAYTRFIIDNIRDRNAGKLFFLSRDGLILRQAYDLLATAEDLPPSAYLLASRRALNFAAMNRLDTASEDWLSQGIGLAVGDFLRRIGLQPEDFTTEIRRCGFADAQSPVTKAHEYDQLRQLYRAIEPHLIAAAAAEKNNYLDYLASEGVLEAQPMLMVDVGWMTSIQYSFHQMLSRLHPGQTTEGFYIGTYADAQLRASQSCKHHGFLLNYGQPQHAFDTIRHCVCLLEFFFASPEKTFLRMHKDPQGKLVPQFAHLHENAADLGYLALIHQGILDFVRNAADVRTVHPFNIPASQVLALLHRLLAEPSQLEARSLGDLHYADGYGAYFNHTRMAASGGLTTFGLNKSKWKRAFKSTHWPKGFVHRMSPVDRWLFHCFHPSAQFVKPLI